jgi:PTS system mannose-specific IIB component
MSISFIRVDDRMIHGQTCTRWAIEYPCDGIVAVNDAAAGNPVLKAAYKAASGKKTFVWTMEHWLAKCQQVIDSDTRYFLITKNPLDLKKILVDQKFQPGLQKVIIGPCNDRPGAVELGNNQSVTPEEAAALEAIHQAGYSVEFTLIPEKSIGNWTKFRERFGFKA